MAGFLSIEPSGDLTVVNSREQTEKEGVLRTRRRRRPRTAKGRRALRRLQVGSPTILAGLVAALLLAAPSSGDINTCPCFPIDCANTDEVLDSIELWCGDQYQSCTRNRCEPVPEWWRLTCCV